MKQTFPISFFILIVFGCTNNANDAQLKPSALPVSLLNERWKAIHTITDSIREGDLVLRCGNDFASASLRDFSQHERLYSHSGVALINNGVMYVYSTMAGDINPDELMRRDNVDSFLSPVNNIAAGVYRYDVSSIELEKLKTIITNHHKNKLQFDMSFDLSTDDKMYCAEMIAKSIEEATGERISFSKSQITPALKEKYLKKLLDKRIIPAAKVADQREYLAIDNLYLNPHCREVKKVIFGEPRMPIRFATPENHQR